MDTKEQSSNSTYNKMINKLRNKTEEELQLLYLKFFVDDLRNEWKEIANEGNLQKASDEDIIRAIQRQRYSR